MISISKMAAAVKPSATLAAGAKARQLKAAGKKVFDFSLGEPDFPTPAHIQEAAIAAMKAGHTHYTPASGIAELRGAVSRYYQKNYRHEVNPDLVTISNGAKHSIHNVLAAIVGPGDEVIIPTPYWVSYSDLVEMTGAKYVLVPTTEASGFRMSAAQLREHITPKTKLLMLNSPSNPTGSVYTRQELEAIADVCVEKGIAVLSDEIYEKLIYGDAQATCFATLRPELKDLAITVSGVSKSYAMTGWRIGWTVAPAHITKAIGNIQSQETSNPCSISQYAAIAALDGDHQCVEDMRQEFAARRDLVCKRLNEIPGLRCPIPGGAFYAFFNVKEHCNRTIGGVKVTDSTSFCAAALEVAHVNLVQGSAFGAEYYARLSFATSRDEINGGLDKLAEFLKG